jgi:anaerobic magnesium-protoporphyrin IX monomethyl ester cyclase
MARIAFLQDVMVEYMGFMCMSAVLKQDGHEVEVFFDSQTNPQRFVKQVLEFKPDVIGFSLLSPSVNWALALAPHFKEYSDALIVMGNVHAMMSPEIIESPGVDMVCIGEGEYALKELCAAIDAKEPYHEIPGFWVKTEEGIIKNPQREDLVDMDAMPHIDRQLYNKYYFFRNSPYLRVMAGRGCPFRCTYCSNPIMTDHYGGSKKYIRKRSPAKVIEEIEYLLANHPHKVKYIQFIDEVFWVKNEWLREFLPMYKERIGLPFFANFRFGAITEDDIRQLAEAGAEAVYLATETADEEQRRKLMNKPVKNEQIIEIAGWMHKYGVKFGVSSFFGLPGDSVQDHVDRLDFYRKLNPRYLWTTFFQPYPGLALTQHPDIQKYMPKDKPFSVTLHHDMYLDLPDRARLANMNKVYHLMMRYPKLEQPLLWLTKFNVPFLFDFLFLLHFAPGAFWWERISLQQWVVHFWIMAVNPVLRKKQPFQRMGRPFLPKGGPPRDRQSVGA